MKLFIIKMSEAAGEMSPADKLQTAMEGLGAADSTIASPVVETPLTEEAPVAAPVAVNPAWNDILSTIPDVLHDSVKAKLAEWDRGVQKRFEEYKPFEEFKGLNPDQIKAGQQLYQTLNQDPKRLYEQLGNFLNTNGQLPQPQQEAVEIGGENSDEEEYDDPRLTELQQNVQRMEQYMQQQAKEQQDKQAETWMDSQQKTITESLKAKNIDPDWGYILPAASGFINAGMEPTAAMAQAAGNFEQLVSRYRPSANQGAPLLMSPGSALPVNKSVDVASLPDKDHKNFASQLLAQAMKDI